MSYLESIEMTFNEAVKLARKIHEGQLDKAGKPFVDHPLRVADKVGDSYNYEMKFAALFHDAVEDTEWTLEDLLIAGVPLRSVVLVDYLTRRKGVPYEQYIDRVCESPRAIELKVIDILDNCDPNRPQTPEIERLIEKRYRPALKKLREEYRRHAW